MTGIKPTTMPTLTRMMEAKRSHHPSPQTCPTRESGAVARSGSNA